MNMNTSDGVCMMGWSDVTSCHKGVHWSRLLLQDQASLKIPSHKVWEWNKKQKHTRLLSYCYCVEFFLRICVCRVMYWIILMMPSLSSIEIIITFLQLPHPQTTEASTGIIRPSFDSKQVLFCSTESWVQNKKIIATIQEFAFSLSREELLLSLHWHLAALSSWWTAV